MKDSQTRNHVQVRPNQIEESANLLASMAEDRAVKLAGYEVFRFGAHELTHGDPTALLRAFFRNLLALHDLSVAPA